MAAAPRLLHSSASCILCSETKFWRGIPELIYTIAWKSVTKKKYSEHGVINPEYKYAILKSLFFTENPYLR